MQDVFHYGAVLKLTREDTHESIRKNLLQMKECGFNTVVIWPAAFYWEEKTEGYPFNTGKFVLDVAQECGIKVVMELAGQHTSFEYAPDYAMKPEYVCVNEDGHREFGQHSFGFINYFNHEVREMICGHFKKCALAYKDHPALLAYDIFNETMYRSFDEWTMEEFRTWLKEKYGTLDKLNQVWERTYSEWSQVGIEKWNWMSIMPQADYAAFRKAAIARFIKPWVDAVRQVDDQHPIMADNIHSMLSPKSDYPRPQDDFDLKNVVDDIGMSFYPKQNNGTMEPALRWEVFDAYYAAAKREGFWIAEMQTHIQALFNPNTCVTLKDLKFWCLEGYAAGAKSLIYWMWRPFTKGIQTLGRGLVNWANEPTERFDLAQGLGKMYAEMGVVKPVRSSVGLLYDPLCEDFQRIFTGNYGLDESLYLNSIFGAYKAMLKNHVRCDIVKIDEIDDYRVIVLSNHLVLGKAAAEKIRAFVEKGGVVIMDGRSALIDEETMQLEQLPGGAINDVMGQRFFDFDNEPSGFEYEGLAVDGFGGRMQMKLTEGVAAATFADGMPAVVERAYGEGCFISINTSVWYGYAMNGFVSVEAFAGMIAAQYGLEQVDTELDMRIRISENESDYLVFLFNDTDEPQCGEVTVLLEDREFTLEVEVGANDAEVYAVEKAQFDEE